MKQGAIYYLTGTYTQPESDAPFKKGKIGHRLSMNGIDVKVLNGCNLHPFCTQWNKHTGEYEFCPSVYCDSDKCPAKKED